MTTTTERPLEQSIASEGLGDLFANPHHYAIVLHEDILWFGERDIEIYRDADHIEFDLSEFVGDNLRHRLIMIPMTNSVALQCRLAFSCCDDGALLRCFDYLPCHAIRSIRHRECSISGDVIIYTPPRGERLSEYASRCDEAGFARLYGAIARLERGLNGCGCYFDGANFTADQLIVGADLEIYPSHLLGLRFDAGVSARGCCDELRGWLHDVSGGCDLSCADTDLYGADFSVGRPPIVSGHIWCGMPHEDRIAVKDASGYGFVNEENRCVIPSKYQSVTSFKEGRSVVESSRGYGLIDVWGDYILEDMYEDMSYDFATGITIAKRCGIWCSYDYCGAMVEEFGSKHPLTTRPTP